MNAETTRCPNRRSKAAYAVAILAAFLIVAALVWAMQHYTQAPSLNANRVAERAKALAEMRASEAESLDNVGWVDQGKGIVRLRIADAMNLAEQEWKNPAEARSNLVARAEKANPPPPPKAPEKPGAFE